MSESGDRTSSWRRTERDRLQAAQAAEILQKVYAALKEKGYDPIGQIVGYLMSGDPAYITKHQGARNLVRRLERDELLEEIVRAYLER